MAQVWSLRSDIFSVSTLIFFYWTRRTTARHKVRLCADNWESSGLKRVWKVQTLIFFLSIDNALSPKGFDYGMELNSFTGVSFSRWYLEFSGAYYRYESKGKWSTSVRFWNDLCQVMWERGNDPTKVLYNCRKIVQLLNFTTAKKNVQLLIHFTTANFYVGIIQKNAQLLFHFTTVKKLYNCKTKNAQQQKKLHLQNKFIAKLMRRHLRDILCGKS